MASSTNSKTPVVRDLAGLIVAVAGESVTMIKRSVPEQSLKLQKRREWEIYLEFLKLLYDLADRLSVFHVAIAEQPRFMQTVEQTITQQLRAMLEPALGADGDEMEIQLTVSQAVAEGRRQYERFRFSVTEDSGAKDQYLQSFSRRIAELMEAPENGMILSSATLCVIAAIPAIKAILTGIGIEQTEGAVARMTAAAQPRPTITPGPNSEIKLLSIVSKVEGEEVETRWGLHPRLRQDLKPEQIKELTRYMNRVTQIVGQRYAAVAFSTEWAPWNRLGHA
jgi:hypothetical protein